MAWGKWERWTDVRVRLERIADRVDQLLTRSTPPSPAEAGDAATGVVAVCSGMEAVLLRVGTEHRDTLSPRARQQVCVAVAQLHTTAESLAELPPLLDPELPRW